MALSPSAGPLAPSSSCERTGALWIAAPRRPSSCRVFAITGPPTRLEHIEIADRRIQSNRVKGGTLVEDINEGLEDAWLLRREGGSVQFGDRDQPASGTWLDARDQLIGKLRPPPGGKRRAQTELAAETGWARAAASAIWACLFSALSSSLGWTETSSASS